MNFGQADSLQWALSCRFSKLLPSASSGGQGSCLSLLGQQVGCIKREHLLSLFQSTPGISSTAPKKQKLVSAGWRLCLKDLEILVCVLVPGMLFGSFMSAYSSPKWTHFHVEKETHGGKMQFDLLIFGIQSFSRVWGKDSKQHGKTQMYGRVCIVAMTHCLSLLLSSCLC